MKRLIDIGLTVIVVSLITAFALAIAFSIVGSSESIIAVTILTTTNLFIPILLAVLIFRFIKTSADESSNLLKQSIILLVILLIGTCIWSFLDVMLSYPWDNLLLQNLKENFISQFLVFIPALFVIAFAIPLTDKFLISKM